MRGNVARNANQPQNVEQPRGENEQARAWNVDYTTSLRDLFAPIATNSHLCIVLPPTNATHFYLKPHVIQLLPSFRGLDLENPYNHVKKFKDICATFICHPTPILISGLGSWKSLQPCEQVHICATFKFQNFSEELVHLRLFHFSLHDKARAWLDFRTPGSITSWESLLSKFSNKSFVMSKVNKYRKEISSFTQEEDEKFSESWERFKELLIKCPPHGYEKWRLKGWLNPTISWSSLWTGGAFLSLTGDEAYKALDKLSDNS